jgi:DNA-binding transcriptional LysR family regulator
MDRFLSIEAFVLVAESQSFAEAARQTRLSKSVITTRVQQLEEFVGAPLFHRSTRSVRLSEIGQAFYRDCAELIGRTNELVDQMRDMKGSPAGVLRVHALPGFVLGHLTRLLREFQDRYPGIVLDLVVNDAVIDPVKEGFDCTLQIFPPSSEALVERRLFPVRRVFCASPEYLKKHGEPKHPKDLLQHRLGLYSVYPTRDRWVFYAGRERIMLELKAALRANSVHLLRDYACEHAGIVCIPTLVAADAVLAGDLKLLLLPRYQLSSFSLSIVFPHTHRGTFKLRLFIESLAANFAGEPPWDQALIERGLIPTEIIE